MIKFFLKNIFYFFIVFLFFFFKIARCRFWFTLEQYLTVICKLGYYTLLLHAHRTWVWSLPIFTVSKKSSRLPSKLYLDRDYRWGFGNCCFCMKRHRIRERRRAGCAVFTQMDAYLSVLFFCPVLLRPSPAGWPRLRPVDPWRVSHDDRPLEEEKKRGGTFRGPACERACLFASSYFSFLTQILYPCEIAVARLAASCRRHL